MGTGEGAHSNEAVIPVIYSREAVLELEDAHDWYEGRVFGLGGEFLEAVRECVNVIQQYPEGFPAAGAVAACAFKAISFEIFYAVTSDSIVIACVSTAHRIRANGRRGIRLTSYSVLGSFGSRPSTRDASSATFCIERLVARSK